MCEVSMMGQATIVAFPVRKGTANVRFSHFEKKFFIGVKLH